jgi:hypothetical protein
MPSGVLVFQKKQRGIVFKECFFFYIFTEKNGVTRLQMNNLCEKIRWRWVAAIKDYKILRTFNLLLCCIKLGLGQWQDLLKKVFPLFYILSTVHLITDLVTATCYLICQIMVFGFKFYFFLSEFRNGEHSIILILFAW